MGKLYEELKRRKVFRAAVIYAVVAWLLIQMADTIAPMMNLPEFAPRLVLFLLIILFPIALLLAWVYEITPDGIKTDTEELSGQPTASTTNLSFLLVGIAAVIASGVFVFNRLTNEPELNDEFGVALTASDSPLGKSIAVLPFNAFSSDPDEQFFADGLSDTLLHKLAQLNDIRVISRTSSFQYRGEAIDVRQVGEELQVATVLEGSVQRSGDQLRIIAQLVNTTDGAHIWSQTFDRHSDDIFAIHDEISNAVVQSLQVTMTLDERQRIQDLGTESVAAYNLLTLVSERSRSTLFDLNSEEYKQQQYFWLAELDRVLEIDPNFAEVYRKKAFIYQGLAFQSYSGQDDEYHIREGFEAIRQAMLLEPSNPSNFRLFGELNRRNRDPVTAEVFARLAIAGNPNDVQAMRALSYTLMSSAENPEEILELYERIRQLDKTRQPFDYQIETAPLRYLGRYDEVIEILRDEVSNSEIPQRVASDLAAATSINSGRHVQLMEDLVGLRNRLEDDVTDRFFNSWLNTSVMVGMIDEIEKLLPRIEGVTARTRFNSILYFQTGQYDQGQSYLEQENLELADTQLNFYLAQHCMMLADFDCAVNNLLLYTPGLESRNDKRPQLNSTREFLPAVALVVSYRKIGEADAAESLLLAMSQNIESRTINGFVHTSFYELPSMYALMGDEDRALQLMRERIDLDGDRFIPMCWHCSFNSPIYESLQNIPEFQALVTEYERRKLVNANSIRGLIEQAGY